MLDVTQVAICGYSHSAASFYPYSLGDMDNITLYYIYMFLVPVPVAPPQWYGPLLPDLESFISMVFTAFWMQNLIFP